MRDIGIFQAKLADIIDINNPKDLWIISFAIARDDLYILANKMKEANDKNNDEELCFFFKWSLSCSCESYKLIKKAFNSKGKKYDISAYMEKYRKQFDELTSVINKNDLFQTINRYRNNVYHYCCGEKFEDSKYDFDRYMKPIKNVISDNPNYLTSLTYAPVSGKVRYSFASDIQQQYLLYKLKGCNINDIFKNLGEICVLEMRLLDSILMDHIIFLIKTKNIKYSCKRMG